MRKSSPRLPPLDLLRGFEAAARHLSFTRAAAELFVTQSAISRQIKTLENHLGVALFERRHRALLLTQEGQELHRATRELMDRLAETLARLGRRDSRMVTVSTTVTFASMWLVPRLAAFRQRHPDIEVRIAAENELIDMARGRIDAVIRYCKSGAAPAGALRLFGERTQLVATPKLAKKIHKPADLARQVMLHLDDPSGQWPWLSWRVWFEVMKLPPVEGAGRLHFSHYDQLIQAALQGQGVALGRSPLVRGALKAGTLTGLFGKAALSDRAYFIAASTNASSRPEVQAFIDWVMNEAKGEPE